MDVIRDKLHELDDLVQANPQKIPLGAAAKFLGVNAEGLKAALMRGNAPFGFAYQKSDGGYRVIVIPTVTFYLWYTHTTARMVLAESEV